MSSTNANAAAWHLMVRPVGGWLAIAEAGRLWQALFWQWLLFSLAGIVSLPLSAQLSGNSQASDKLGLQPLGVLLGMAVLVPLLNAAFGGFCWLIFRFIGIPRSFLQFLNWSAHGLLPFALGALLGQLSLALLHPSTMVFSLLPSLELRGISLGAASWFPASFPPLAYDWVLFNFLDVFGLWSLLLLALGLRHYLKSSRVESQLGSLCLVLIVLMLLTGTWQVLVHQAAG